MPKQNMSYLKFLDNSCDLLAYWCGNAYPEKFGMAYGGGGIMMGCGWGQAPADMAFELFSWAAYLGGDKPRPYGVCTIFRVAVSFGVSRV